MDEPGGNRRSNKPMIFLISNSKPSLNRQGSYVLFFNSIFLLQACKYDSPPPPPPPPSPLTYLNHRIGNTARSLTFVGTFCRNRNVFVRKNFILPTSIHAILASTTEGFNKVLIGTMPVVLARMAKNGVNWRQQSRVRFEKSRTNFAEVRLMVLFPILCLNCGLVIQYNLSFCIEVVCLILLMSLV